MIPVYQPWLTSLEKKYANEALESGWISSTGKFVTKAEELFAEFIGVKHAIVTTSGTTALHLCLRALDKHLQPGAVLIPDTTFIASAFAASYDSREVKLIDVDPQTWNIDLDLVEEYLKNHPVSIIMPVHLYGNPVDMERLKDLQKIYGFKIVEDACEALGASINGKRTGTWSDTACFSFYGNKTFTSGEGGAAVTNDDDFAAKIKLLRGQAQDPNKRYWHIDVGYNYRMTNVQAAILCGQLERADVILEEKKRVADRYQKALGGHLEFQKVLNGHQHSNWLVTLKLPIKQGPISDLLRSKYQIDSRKIFYPISTMPPYFAFIGVGTNSLKLSECGLSLPSYPELTNSEIDYISESLLKCLKDLSD